MKRPNRTEIMYYKGVGYKTVYRNGKMVLHAQITSEEIDAMITAQKEMRK